MRCIHGIQLSLRCDGVMVSVVCFQVAGRGRGVDGERDERGELGEAAVLGTSTCCAASGVVLVSSSHGEVDDHLLPSIFDLPYHLNGSHHHGDYAQTHRCSLLLLAQVARGISLICTVVCERSR